MIYRVKRKTHSIRRKAVQKDSPSLLLLLRVQVVVVPALAQQLAVRADLGDAAALDDQDAVGALDGRQPVGDDEAGAARISVSMPCWISASVSVSTELVASSMMNISGRASTARARLSSCFCPPRAGCRPRPLPARSPFQGR
jgi:hypothetical protein